LIVILATFIALVLSAFVLKSIECIWSPWNHFMPSLLSKPLARTSLDEMVAQASRKEPPDFSLAAAGAARVAKRFDGPWKRAARWWQLWESRQRIGPGLGLKELTVCPDMISVDSIGKGLIDSAGKGLKHADTAPDSVLVNTVKVEEG
jgi:hypothetical protein